MRFAHACVAIILSFMCIVILYSPAKADIYLHEGFNGPGLPAGWMQVRLTGTQASWSVVATGSHPNIPPYAGTGMARFNSFDAAAGEQARLISPRIDLTSAADPFVIFFMYHDDEYAASYDSLYVEATTGDSIGGPWIPLLGVERPRPYNAWRKEAVSLYAYRGTNRVFLSLRGISRYGNNIFVDEFRVADSSFHDIGIIGLIPSEAPSFSPLSEPAVMTSSRVSGSGKRISAEFPAAPMVYAFASPQSALTVNAVARNFGTFSEPMYSISWTIDGIAQPSFPGGPLEPRTGLDTTTLVWMNPAPGFHAFTAWSVFPLDSNRLNDTARVTAYVLESGTVFYELFNASVFPPPGWITINRDGGTLPAWFRGADTSAFLPFEGSGFAANNFQRANGTYLDDYLISPQVTGVGQPGLVDSLVFHVRSQLNAPPAPNFPDSLMVLLSSGGADTSSFNIVLDYFDVPKGTWTRKAYVLTGRVPPNSTVRVAFRYLLFNVQASGGSGDFIGIDAVRIVRTTALAVEPTIPAATFALEQNYPNPFNPTTHISYTIPASVSEPSGTLVSLRVYNILGQKIATLVSERKHPGRHTITFDGEKLPTGIYLYHLRVGNFNASRKMLLMR